jgi:DNA-binding CsgD family transcriptional regulator
LAWSDAPREVREAAERACTEKQLEALHFIADGYSTYRTARILGLSRQAVVARLEAARLNIKREMTAADRPPV